MDIRFETLRVLASLVIDAPQPTQYQCLPRQLILLSSYDWATIYTHLLELEKEELVKVVQADNIQFSITQKGIEKVVSLEAVKENKTSHSLK